MIYIRNPTYPPKESETRHATSDHSIAALWSVDLSAWAWISTVGGLATACRGWTRDGGGSPSVMFTRTRTSELLHTEIASIAIALQKQLSQPVCTPCRSSLLVCR